MGDDGMLYMAAHPPRCVRAYVGEVPVELCDFVRREYGPNSTVFGVRCACKHAAIEVSGPEPLAVSCAHCGTAWVLFDPTLHGYDGELGHNKPGAQDASNKFSCPKCKGRRFELAAGFQYSGETDILEDLDFAPKGVRPEDLFGWFILAGRCTGCGSVELVYECECA